MKQPIWYFLYIIQMTLFWHIVLALCTFTVTDMFDEHEEQSNKCRVITDVSNLQFRPKSGDKQMPCLKIPRKLQCEITMVVPEKPIPHFTKIEKKSVKSFLNAYTYRKHKYISEKLLAPNIYLENCFSLLEKKRTYFINYVSVITKRLKHILYYNEPKINSKKIVHDCLVFMKKLSTMLNHYHSIHSSINTLLEAIERLTCFSNLSQLNMCFSIYKTPLEKLMSADPCDILPHLLRIGCYKKISAEFIKAFSAKTFFDFKSNLGRLIEEMHTHEAEILQQLLHHINVLSCRYKLTVHGLFTSLEIFYISTANSEIRRLRDLCHCDMTLQSVVEYKINLIMLLLRQYNDFSCSFLDCDKGSQLQSKQPYNRAKIKTCEMIKLNRLVCDYGIVHGFLSHLKPLLALLEQCKDVLVSSESKGDEIENTQSMKKKEEVGESGEFALSEQGSGRSTFGYLERSISAADDERDKMEEGTEKCVLIKKEELKEETNKEIVNKKELDDQEEDETAMLCEGSYICKEKCYEEVEEMTEDEEHSYLSVINNNNNNNNSNEQHDSTLRKRMKGVKGILKNNKTTHVRPMETMKLNAYQKYMNTIKKIAYGRYKNILKKYKRSNYMDMKKVNCVKRQEKKKKSEHANRFNGEKEKTCIQKDLDNDQSGSIFNLKLIKEKTNETAEVNKNKIISTKGEKEVRSTISDELENKEYVCNTGINACELNQNVFLWLRNCLFNTLESMVFMRNVKELSMALWELKHSLEKIMKSLIDIHDVLGALQFPLISLDIKDGQLTDSDKFFELDDKSYKSIMQLENKINGVAKLIDALTTSGERNPHETCKKTRKMLSKFYNICKEDD